jgi:hypothetical protein
MPKSKPIIFIFLLIISFNKVLAQDPIKIAEDKDSKRDTKTYHIKSMDGINSKIHFMPNYWEHILKISCLKDTITCNDFWGAPIEIRVLKKYFIQIKYDVRGGSNFALGNILILCVRGNKLCEAIHILRYSSWDGLEKADYSVRLTLHGSSKKEFKLYAVVHDKMLSYSSPEKNYTYNDQSILSFDDKLDVFYSVKNEVDNTFNVSNTIDGKTHKQEIVENLHQIILGTENYYLLKDGWYELQRENILQKFSFDRN